MKVWIPSCKASPIQMETSLQRLNMVLTRVAILILRHSCLELTSISKTLYFNLYEKDKT
jgi:hypothetical protein